MQSSKNCFRLRCTRAFAFAIAMQLVFLGKSFGSTVTNLTATYSNGQVFLTWTNVSSTNQQYNVYRSSSKLTSSSQLNSSTLLGFVRDSSSKNYRLSQLDKKNIFFKIKDNGQPLAANQGLYAVTCANNNKSYYYAVTVTDLSSGTEYKQLTLGKNSLSSSVTDKTVKPLPVLQDSIVSGKSGIGAKYRYVQFVNNQQTPLWPAMNSTGSFEMNFYFEKLGTVQRYPLMVMFNGDVALSTKKNATVPLTFTYGYILGLDDYLPLKEGKTIGSDDYFMGYYQNFNIYTNDNPIPTSGIIKVYAQKSYLEAINWAESHFPVDTSMVYATGDSHTGFGALITATTYPQKFAAIYVTVEPINIGPSGDQIYEEEWGMNSTKLNTDFMNPQTGLPIPITDFSDARAMVHNDELLNMPLIFDVHGKNDTKVLWAQSKIDWLDSVQSNHIGGAFYWDQRQHGGDGKNFTTDETTPDFFRYQTTKSYPAFSNCTINQNPGNGDKNSGAPWGGINSYLDFNDNITDQKCNYSVMVFIKDLYVGGVLAPIQYDTCTSDVTIRRLQNFRPKNGQTVNWANYNINNVKIQSGSFVYTGRLITLTGMKINKTGNTLTFSISGCSGPNDRISAGNTNAQPVYFSRDASGYLANIKSSDEEVAAVTIYDVMGRMVSTDRIYLSAGVTHYRIPKFSGGTYFVKIEGATLHFSQSILFE